jgi:16S rRNA (uracil1498-N3)-methyltransferase
MRLHRFNVVQPLGEEVVIDEVSLINQWTKVFRYTAGDFVILFNGDGNDYCYSITVVSKHSCTLRRESSSPSVIPTKKTYLYLAIIKKDHFELAAQKATELGITDIVPLITERTEKKPLDLRRLSLITKEASEQSGRGDVLVIHEPVTLTAITEHLQNNSITIERTFATTLFGTPVNQVIKNSNVTSSTPCAFIVGPEGGWTDAEELFLEKNSFVRISFGATTLRAETAGIVSSFLSTLL